MPYKVFILFENVQIPKGATIEEAHIYAYKYETHTFNPYGAHWFACWFGAVDDATAPTSQAELDAIPLTTKKCVNGDDPLADSYNAVGAGEQFLLIKGTITTSACSGGRRLYEVVQEVVDRPGWAAGNNMIAIIDSCDGNWDYPDGFVKFYAVDHGDPSKYPYLYAEWSA